jgi:hypothetical protein
MLKHHVVVVVLADTEPTFVALPQEHEPFLEIDITHTTMSFDDVKHDVVLVIGSIPLDVVFHVLEHGEGRISEYRINLALPIEV